MKISLRIKLPSLLNTRMSWQAMASLKKKQRRAVHRGFSGKRLSIPLPPLVVTMTRVGPQRLDDDNLQGACKYVRDQIAAEVGVDDGSDLYTWVYRQRFGSYGVDIEITERLW